MRTCFEPEEAEEFESAKDLLARRCLAWADEHGLRADEAMLAAALDARHRSRDGRLAQNFAMPCRVGSASAAGYSASASATAASSSAKEALRGSRRPDAAR